MNFEYLIVGLIAVAVGVYLAMALLWLAALARRRVLPLRLAQTQRVRGELGARCLSRAAKWAG